MSGGQPAFSCQRRGRENSGPGAGLVPQSPQLLSPSPSPVRNPVDKHVGSDYSLLSDPRVTTENIDLDFKVPAECPTQRAPLWQGSPMPNKFRTGPRKWWARVDVQLHLLEWRALVRVHEAPCARVLAAHVNGAVRVCAHACHLHKAISSPPPSGPQSWKVWGSLPCGMWHRREIGMGSLVILSAAKCEAQPRFMAAGTKHCLTLGFPIASKS